MIVMKAVKTIMALAMGIAMTGCQEAILQNIVTCICHTAMRRMVHNAMTYCTSCMVVAVRLRSFWVVTIRYH